MDKTLDMVVLVHRLIIGVALALFLVGVTIQPANSVYDDAEDEIQTLTNGITAISDQVDQAYKIIYDKSELKSATHAWLQTHNGREQNFDIEVVSPADFAVPDSSRDPLVTLDAQVKWADRIYRDLDFPFLLCDVDRSQLFHSLDKLLGVSAKPTFTRLSVSVRDSVADANVNRQFSCKIALEYEVRMGTLIGVRSAILDVPTTVVNITEVKLPGSASLDLNIPDALKGNKLGDWEDTRAVLVPKLWELWNDVGSRSPVAATAFLEQKKEEEAEKSKEKIDILGESLSRSVTIIMASLVEFSLMVYLLAHLIQVRRMLPGHEAAISESPFYGIMCTSFGRLLILFTFLIPVGVCIFVLIGVFPSLKAEWTGPHWVVGWVARWLLVIFLAITDTLLILQVRRTVALLDSRAKNAPASVEGQVT